jgi:hypothetical protein
LDLELPLLPQAARVAAAMIAAAVGTSRTRQCLFIADTLFPVTTGTAPLRHGSESDVSRSKHYTG